MPPPTSKIRVHQNSGPIHFELASLIQTEWFCFDSTILHNVLCVSAYWLLVDNMSIVVDRNPCHTHTHTWHYNVTRPWWDVCLPDLTSRDLYLLIILGQFGQWKVWPCGHRVDLNNSVSRFGYLGILFPLAYVLSFESPKLHYTNKMYF